MPQIREMLREFQEGEISVSKDVWHYRFYRFWVDQTGGNKVGYRENLCHYVRVVLFWAPAAWALYKPLLMDIPFAGFVGIALYLAVLRIAPVPVLILTAYCLLLWKRDKFRKYIIKVGNYGPNQFFNWFLNWGNKGLYPWTVTLAVLAIWLVMQSIAAYGLREILVLVGKLMLIVAVASLAAAVIAGVLILIRLLAVSIIGQFPTRREPEIRPKATSTFSIVAHYILAKKKKICPFINLPSEDELYLVR